MKTNLPAKIPPGDRLALDLVKAAMQYVNDPRAPLTNGDRCVANLSLLGISLLIAFSD